jgi:hypothetical protein
MTSIVRGIVFIALTACVAETDGDSPVVPGGGGAVSGGGDGTTPDAGTLSWPEGAPACEAPAAPPGTGMHNPGKPCLNCHAFTLAGTLYTSATGSTGRSGATITIRDSAGKTFEVVTQQNGNFYLGGLIKFPVLVAASSCPSVKQMPSAAMNGNCNACHGGGTNMQMHLP